MFYLITYDDKSCIRVEDEDLDLKGVFENPKVIEVLRIDLEDGEVTEIENWTLG